MGEERFWQALPTILAQQDSKTVLESLRLGFNGPSYGPIILLFLCFALALIGIVLAVYVIRRRQEVRDHLHSPRALFAELAAAHALSVDQRKLLVNLAKSAHLDRADRLFVRPDFFDLAASGSRFASPVLKEQLADLRYILYATEPGTREA